MTDKENKTQEDDISPEGKEHLNYLVMEAFPSVLNEHIKNTNISSNVPTTQTTIPERFRSFPFSTED